MPGLAAAASTAVVTRAQSTTFARSVSAPARSPQGIRSATCFSPDHAVFIDGVLIPVRYLINGRTIVQEPADEVTYYHVELPRHDVIFAEGLPC